MNTNLDEAQTKLSKMGTDKIEALQVRIERLNQGDLDRTEALTLVYINTLLKRAEKLPHGAAERVYRKADQLITGCEIKLQQHETSGGLLVGEPPPNAATRSQEYGQATAALVQLNEFIRHQRRVQTQDAETWTSLSLDEMPDASAVATDELKAYRRLKAMQKRQRAEKLVASAVSINPENPGPLNPQMLVTKSLSLMQEHSPAYLNRMVSYLDALFSIEHLGQQLESDDTTPK